ncbi:glycoside hydrolase family 16 protein [Luteolibacter marinus]|uniref:glycoside hydrolase family 16 protein n=1 Tax=Luteolibacter marinus TaxID=2776705 RepID=UPI00186778D8|nr:glycoside hydrolase family 16 protein [Luteolibacter marinus]
MKFLFALCLSVASASAAPEGMKLVWADEFDAPGLPDPAKWGCEKGMIRNNEKQFYTDKRKENARIEDGKLIIEAHKEKKDRGEFTSASLTTEHQAAWTYGRVEVRAKIPAARGTWPAIWMLPTDIGKLGWPKCGEIDIMEHVGFDHGVVHGTLHSETYNHTKGTQRGTKVKVPDASEAFHVYSVDWSAEKIEMAVDGKTYATYKKEKGDTPDEWPFDKPFYLILNLAVGGGWGGMKWIDDAAFPQRMEVDYVRVYQQDR